MADPDSIQVNAGTGPSILGDYITTLNGVLVASSFAQRFKLGVGADGVFVDISTAAPLPVQIHGGLTSPVSQNGTRLQTETSGTVSISGAVDTELPAAAALSDALANPTSPVVGAAALQYNGATLERQRGNVAVGLWNGAGGDGARTTTFSSADQTNYNARGLMVNLKTTVVPGTDTIQLRIGSRGAYGAGLLLYASAAFATGGDRVFIFYPGVDPSYVAQAVTEVKSLIIPRVFTVSVQHSGSGSFTYDLSYSLVQ